MPKVYLARVIIDFHTHIFPPEIIADRAKYMPREDWFAHLYGNPTARMASAEDLITEMDRCGVDRAVACGFAWNSFDLCVETNSYVADAAQRWPERIIGFANVPPLHPRAEAELERCVSLGLKGIGELMPDGQGFDLAGVDSLRPLADIARTHSLPLLIHLSEPVGHSYPGKGWTTPDKGYKFASKFPDLAIVFAHWGGGLPFYELMPDVKKALSNVFYDCAATLYLYDTSIFRVARELLGPEKILFGSDFPLISPERYTQKIKEAGLSNGDLDAIMGGNALALLKRKER